MTGHPDELTLTGAPPVAWVWWAGDDMVVERPEGARLPAGVLFDHGDHTLLVPWTPYLGVRHFTLDTLIPLTVVEPVTCGACGLAGRIAAGAWRPAKARR